MTEMFQSVGKENEEGLHPRHLEYHSHAYVVEHLERIESTPFFGSEEVVLSY